MTKHHSLSFTLFLLLSDAVIVITVLRLAVYLRTVLPLGKFSVSYDVPLVLNFIVIAIFTGTYISYGLYNANRTRKIIQEIQHVVVSTSIGWFILIGVLYLSYRNVSRLLMGYFFVLLIVSVVTHRIVIRGFFRIVGGRSFDSRNVLILGSGELVQKSEEALLDNAWAGYYLVGSMAIDAHDLNAFLKTVEARVINENISDLIIISDTMDTGLVNLIQKLHNQSADIHMMPNIRELIFINAETTSLNDLPLITIKRPSLDPFQRLVKRMFDLAVGSLLLVITLPVMAVIALLIWLDNPGSPVFFLQDRVGEKRQTFKMLKFRTMEHHAQNRHASAIQSRVLEEINHKMVALRDVSRMGMILRRFALDELPQLINVIRGDMSLVGPRPEMPTIVEKYQSWQMKRFEVPQGMTGWWQVTRTHDSLMHLSTDADLYYIRNYSLWLDIRILFMTIPALLRGRGAY